MSIANTYIIIVKKMSGSKVEVEAEAEALDHVLLLPILLSLGIKNFFRFLFRFHLNSKLRFRFHFRFHAQTTASTRFRFCISTKNVEAIDRFRFGGWDSY